GGHGPYDGESRDGSPLARHPGSVRGGHLVRPGGGPADARCPDRTGRAFAPTVAAADAGAPPAVAGGDAARGAGVAAAGGGAPARTADRGAARAVGGPPAAPGARRQGPRRV